jgi:excisionase family DNA binding protein
MRTAANEYGRNRPVAVPDDEWLTVPQAAALMRCGRTTVFGLIGDGTLPSVKPGRARLVKRADVVAHLEQLRGDAERT